jgi:hypothetical protein
MLVYSQELQKIFAIHIIIYKNDTVGLVSFETSQGTLTDFPEITPVSEEQELYSIIIVSTDNKILFNKSFIIGWVAHPFNKTDVILNESDKYFRLNYFDSASKIEILHDNRVIFSYNLCKPDGICDALKGENNINCPQDCLQTIATTIPKPICGNNICETNLGENFNNCPQDCLPPKLPPKPKTPIYVYIIIISVIFVIIALFLYKIRIVKVKQYVS